jgi:hypothetical protein
LEKSGRGGTPTQAFASRSSIPVGAEGDATGNTAPLRGRQSRTAEWPSRCQVGASPGALGVNDKARRGAATPAAARLGTMAIMRRLYSQARRQTIELLVRAAMKMDWKL